MASAKKDPYRFQIKLDESDPIQRKVAEILSKQGRSLSKFISDAVVVATENQPTITEWLTMQQQFLTGATINSPSLGPQVELKPERGHERKNERPRNAGLQAVQETHIVESKQRDIVKAVDEEDGFHIDFDENPEDEDDNDVDDMDDFAIGMSAFN